MQKKLIISLCLTYGLVLFLCNPVPVSASKLAGNEMKSVPGTLTVDPAESFFHADQRPQADAQLVAQADGFGPTDQLPESGAPSSQPPKQNTLPEEPQPQPKKIEKSPVAPVGPSIMKQPGQAPVKMLPEAQQQPLQQPVQQPSQQPLMQPPATLLPQQTVTKRGDVSFNFDDADVFSVIQTIFGDVLKVNYIVDARVKGRVNFRSVAPVAKEDVLPLMEVILRLNGIGIVEEGGLYRIVPIGDLPKEPATVGVGREAEAVKITGKALLQVVPVFNIQSTEMVRLLTPFLSAAAVIIDVPKSNHIVIIDTDTNVKRLLRLVEIFDSENLKQVKPRVFVYSVQNGKAKEVASLLQQIFLSTKSTAAGPPGRIVAPPRTLVPGQTTQQPTAPDTQPQMFAGATGTASGELLVSDVTRIIPDEITNSIVILGTPEDYAVILSTLQQIDIVPRQVMIEAVVAEVKLTDNLRFGLQWLIQNDVKLQIDPFTRDINLDGALAFTSKILDPTLTYTALDLSGNVKLLIQALADDNKANIISSPHLLVSDNREARIQVGDQIPIATSTTTTPLSGVTNSTTSTIQYKDTGTILKVKPQVNDSGLVALELSQEVSKGNTILVLGTQQFVVTKREISTNLVVQDGQTIVLGGLIDETRAKGRSGIPFLSKIPILGYLFGSTIDDTSRTELIILLTPHVIKSQKEAEETSSGYIKRFKANTNINIDELRDDKSNMEQSDAVESHKDSGQGGP